MGLSYDFERLMKRHPHWEGDRRRLLCDRAARNLMACFRHRSVQSITSMRSIRMTSM
jgi:hypothetical protein